MTARALLLAPFAPHHLDVLGRTIDVCYESWLDTRRIQDPDRLASRLARERISILVVESDFVFEDMFQQAPELRFVGVCRNTVGHIDVEAATRHGVVVVNTPQRNARAVGEHVLGLMLALARKIPAADSYVRDGRWQNPAEPYVSMRGVELAGRTLGIIGLGATGTTLAEIGTALRMRVIGFDPYVGGPPEGVSLVEIDRLMSDSDFVCIHVPALAETEGLVSADLLGLMKPTAFLVNASDASVVDRDALVEALKDGRIAGGAFDVFESHPVAPDSPLLALDNVVLSPHLGGATAETIERHSQMMADDILRFVQGRRPWNMVNPEVWHRLG